MADDTTHDILDEITAGTPRPSQSYPKVAVEQGMTVLHRSSGKRGRVRRFTGDVVELRDAKGADHAFRNHPGAFAVQGETVILVAPLRDGGGQRTRRSAAGAVVAEHQQARVARASRLWVEGDHDARLVERVWGDELREMGVVVEPLGGIDDLAGAIRGFGPGPERLLVVLVDHLVTGSKEARMAHAVAAQFGTDHVRVVGHPFVDVWQCVRASAVGLDEWPAVPIGEDWKMGVCARLGWGSPAEGWKRVLAAVDSFAQLDPALVNAVEQALDVFAAEDGQ